MTGPQRAFYNEINPPRPVYHPCELGHRWAWLTNGRQACGICGRPR